MTILAIETSCDETGIAIVEFKKDGTIKKVIVNLIASQIETHSPFGGVVPHLAAREHQKNIPILLRKAKVNQLWDKIDAIAVTNGPGLSPCLWQGVNTARALSNHHDKPLVAVNHLAGHIYSNWPFEFPALALIVSGGHTELVLMKDHLKYKVLGETRDDAAGEAFDKVAKLLGLGYPGGPLIEKLAKKGNPKAFEFPRPMIDSSNYEFSFSGLKTAVRYLLEKQPKAKKEDVAASFQQAVLDVLKFKTEKAQQEYKPKSIVMGGGVTANLALKKAIPQAKAPEIKLALDNALMIAMAGFWQVKNKQFTKPKELEADPNLVLG
jgi:N6-L-threonylcarbamoyladenine synthase